MKKCSGEDEEITSLQLGQALSPKTGLVNAEKRPFISLVQRTPYSRASSHNLFQVDAISSVATTTVSDGWVSTLAV